MSKVPRWLRDYFKETDFEQVHQLIQEIELTTQAELVPLIVRCSVDLHLVQALFLMISLSLGMILGPVFFNSLDWHLPLSTEWMSLLLSVFFMGMAFPLSKSSRILKFALSNSYLQHCVLRRATLEFFSNKLHHSQSRTAVLFMYSVLERKAMIIADPNLTGIPQSLWEGALQKMIAAAKSKNLRAGFEEAFRETAPRLSQAAPPQKENTNEISDWVIIKN